MTPNYLAARKFISILVLLVPFYSHAIVRRGDVPDSSYVVNASKYQQAVIILNTDGEGPKKKNPNEFNAECAGTMISRKHAVTAAHCVCDGKKKGYKVTVAGEKHKVVKTYLNPDCVFKCNQDGPNKCDCAVVEFGSEVKSTDLIPYNVYNDTKEVGKIIQIVGWGVTGTANNISKHNCNDGPEDGKLRHAENVVISANGVIKYKMVKPNAGALPLEGICASGDSGGPAFLTINNHTFIAGVNSGSDDNNGCIYGAIDQFNRLSEQYQFIQNAISGILKPSFTYEY